MQRIVLTGGPGAGKTTTINLLNHLGFETGRDAARSIIRERKKAGLPPRPDPITFAQQVLDQEMKAYRSPASSPSFFERGVVDAVAFMVETGGMTEVEAGPLLEACPYQAVFVFPPWEEIYCMDEERDQTFAHAERVFEATLAFYRDHGYKPVQVPLLPPPDRVQFILRQLECI